MSKVSVNPNILKCELSFGLISGQFVEFDISKYMYVKIWSNCTEIMANVYNWMIDGESSLKKDAAKEKNEFPIAQ